MLWLERPPWLRWAAATTLVLVALWGEFAPPPSTTLTFLKVDVVAGTPLTDDLVEQRSLPDPGFVTVDPAGVAVTDLRAGDPLVASMVTEAAVPAGWLVISAPLPEHAVAGMAAKGVILPDAEESPAEFPAVVVAVGGDGAFDDAAGTLAVPPEWLGRAAAAAGAGRLVVGVTSAGR